MNLIVRRLLERIEGAQNLVVVLLLSIALLGTSCNQAAPSVQREPQAERRVVIEVTTNAEGMVYPLGSVLDLRLYTDGYAEYDWYPPAPKGPHIIQRPQVTRKGVQLAPEQVRELVNLAQQPDFLGAKARYEPPQPTIDATFVKTVTYTDGSRQKVITVINHYDPDRTGYYPRSLSDLIDRVDEMRRSWLGW